MIPPLHIISAINYTRYKFRLRVVVRLFFADTINYLDKKVMNMLTVVPTKT